MIVLNLLLIVLSNRPTLLSRRSQKVKTSPFHGGIPGSSPGGVTNLINNIGPYIGRYMLKAIGEEIFQGNYLLLILVIEILQFIVMFIALKKK